MNKCKKVFSKYKKIFVCKNIKNFDLSCFCLNSTTTVLIFMLEGLIFGARKWEQSIENLESLYLKQSANKLLKTNTSTVT